LLSNIATAIDVPFGVPPLALASVIVAALFRVRRSWATDMTDERCLNDSDDPFTN